MASLLKTKNRLNFKALRNSMAECLSAIPDSRQQNKCEYNQHDILISAFACMYFQDASLLYLQKRLEQNQQRNNLRNIFNVQNIPSNNQLSDVLYQFH
ncbi:MAG: hypothetical protein ACI9VT_004048 [Psychroserpens sp.]